jgi:hypothetical protein
MTLCSPMGLVRCLNGLASPAALAESLGPKGPP